jgi:Asp-tRNA(Asn)/Glu-tRNA(Gln) amidotransferase A subunit family amidase
MQPDKNYPIIVNNESYVITPLTNALSGLRLTVKDLFHINGLPTSAGNPDWLRSHPIPKKTNSVVLHLLEQGAEYVGKALTDELAYSLNGQNIHYPKVVNALSPDRIAGGSSSGSALAVANNLADIGLGTDTGGSVRVPASYNGLFGLRTSHGLVAADNMVSLAPSFDTVGWLTQTIEHMVQVTESVINDTTYNVDTASTISLKVLSNLIDDSEQCQHIERWLESLQGVELDKTVVDLDAWNISEVFRTLQGYEIWQQHGQWIEQTQPVFADDIQNRFSWCKTISEKTYAEAYMQQQAIIERILSLFDDGDFIVLPTTPGLAPLADTSASDLVSYRNKLMSLTSIAGLAGLPQLHLPLFHLDGVPCGLSLIGRKGQDLTLVKMSEALMQRSAG